MQRPATSILLGLLFVCASWRAFAQDAAVEERASEITVAVDPRIELLAAVQLISPSYNQRTRLITRQEFTYKKRMQLQFAPYADHRAVQLFDEMSRQGFSFDAPVETILHYSDPPELEPLGALPEFTLRRAGGQERLDAFIEALRAFARDTFFMDFFDNHATEYEKMLHPVRDHLSGIEIDMLEAYYGVKQSGYHIILAPLFHPGGFGPSVTLAEGEPPHIHSVMGPHGTEGNLPTFGSADDFRYLVWHEFSHSFVNPVVDAHGEEVDRYAALFEPLRERMARQAYRNWRTCVYEHVVRAVTCRFAAREQGAQAGRDAIEYESSRAFVYVQGLCARLEAYEANREEHETFAAFFPELIEVFEEAAGEE